MREIIDILAEALGTTPLIANRTQDLGECVVYEVYTMSADRIKKRSQMKINVYAQTMERALELEDMCDTALLTLGDTPLTPGVHSVTRTGGGWLEDGDRHMRIAYYEVIERFKPYKPNIEEEGK